MANWQDYYELKKWKGMDMYQCKVCPFSTIGYVTDILAHVRGHYPAQLVRDLAGTEEDADVLGSVDAVEWVTHSTADEEE